MGIKKRTTLVLEDDPVQLMLFQSIVSGLKDVVIGSDNIEDAIRIVRDSGIAACVVDLGVYRKNMEYDPQAGIDFIKEARRVGGEAMPIIVVTSADDRKALVPCFEAGCDDYVLKSEGVEGAVERLKRWLKALPIPVDEMRTKRAAVVSLLNSVGTTS